MSICQLVQYKISELRNDFFNHYSLELILMCLIISDKKN